MWCQGEHNQDLQNKETQEVKKCDVNLDTIFQIADEVMQTPPNNCLVKAVTPEKRCPVAELSSNPCSATLCDSSASTVQANPLCVTPIIMAVSGNVDLVKCMQQEESMVSVPEQMPEDAISEVRYSADVLKAFSFILSKGENVCQERLGHICLAISEQKSMMCILYVKEISSL